MDCKQKIYLASGIILIIIILMIGFLIKPLVSEIKKSAVVVSEENQRLKSFKNFDAERTALLEADYQRIRNDLALFKINLNEKQTIGFIMDLEKQADNSAIGLEIRSAEFPKFVLYLTGDFPNLMKFLGWLENSQYLINVESLSIGKLSESNNLRAILEIGLPSNKSKAKNESE